MTAAAASPKIEKTTMSKVVSSLSFRVGVAAVAVRAGVAGADDVSFGRVWGDVAGASDGVVVGFSSGK
jgi:hypothetical protein